MKNNANDFAKKLSKSQLLSKLAKRNIKGGNAIGCPPPLGYIGCPPPLGAIGCPPPLGVK